MHRGRGGGRPSGGARFPSHRHSQSNSRTNSGEQNSKPVWGFKSSNAGEKGDRPFLLGELWYVATELLEKKAIEALNSGAPRQRGPSDRPEVLRSQAEQILRDQAQLYSDYQRVKSRRNADWLRKVIASGTASDKQAALSAVISESPVHTLSSLRALLATAEKSGPREGRLTALRAVRDLMISVLLPPERPLVYFKHRNLALLAGLSSVRQAEPLSEREQLLFLWQFESELKGVFAQLVALLSECTSDIIEHFKSSCLHYAYDLLVARPEGESNLLILVANKLGDSHKKVGSKAVYLLGNLINQHPKMKSSVVQEVERILVRPNISVRAQYYALIFLNQIPLLRSVDEQLAGHLISIYFSLFRRYWDASPDDNPDASRSQQITESERGKLLGALLTGVNRAFPFAPAATNWDVYREHIDHLFKIAHAEVLGRSIQALQLIFQVMRAQNSVLDRFYRALYEKLLAPDVLTTHKKSAMLFNLLFKSLKVDDCVPRVAAIVKRLLQVASYHNPAFICGSLFFVSELIKVQPFLFTHIAKLEDLASKQSSSSSLSTIDNSDDDDKRDSDNDANDNDANDNDDNDNDDKSDNDADDNDADDNDNDDNDDDDNDDDDNDDEQPAGQEDKKTTVDSYNPRARDPRFAGTQDSFLWELNLLAHHYHPSVERFASNLLEGTPIVYAGDPLADFSLIAFLDKFSFRKPRQVTKERGFAIMKPPEKTITPVNTEDFLKLDESAVDDSDRFFRLYFQERRRRQIALEHNSKNRLPDELCPSESDDDDDEEDVDDDKKRSKRSLDLDMDEEVDEEAVAKAFAADSDDSDEFSDEDFDDDDDEMTMDPQKLMQMLAVQSSDDDDDDDDGGIGENNMFSSRKKSTFALAEDFAEMLEDFGKDDEDKREGGRRRKLTAEEHRRKQKQEKEIRKAKRRASPNQSAKKPSAKKPAKKSSTKKPRRK